MRKWIERVVAFISLVAITSIAITNIPVYSGVVSLSGVIDSTLTDTTAADTSNCIDLYKPYPIRIPPGTDSLVGRALLQDFADYLDLQVDEIYARVRAAVCQKLAEEIEVVDAIPPCTIMADTLWPCSEDTLTLVFHAIVVKDTGTARDIGSAILLYEGLNDSSTTDGVPGPEFAGFVVNRANGSGNADTNSIEASYTLVMPINDGSSENRRVPGNTNAYGTNTALTGNSELLTDANGNLFWVDRDWHPRIIIDTIVADTMNPHTNDGQMEVFAQHINFKGYDENRALVGKWVGVGQAVTSLHLYEAQDNGTSDLELRANEAMDLSWDLQFPDTVPEWRPSIWRFTELTGANQAPTWVPYDDEIVFRGTDTVSCNTSSKTINIRSRTRVSSTQGEIPPYETPYSWFVTIDVIDLIIRTDHTPDDTNFAPSVGTRRDSIYVYQELNMDFFDTDNPQIEPSGAYFTTDSTFTIKTPQVGCDTVIGIHWMAVGRSEKYLGRGN